MPSKNPDADIGQEGSPDARPSNKVSFQNDATVIEEGGGGDETDNNGDDDDDGSSSSPPTTTIPLHHSSRIKGYITLFVSALYCYMAATHMKDLNGAEELRSLANLCLYLDDLGNLVDISLDGLASRLRLVMACSMLTLILTGLILLIHFDFCTPLRKSIWLKWFGSSGNVELYILIFLAFFWLIATWFNTSIRGPAGEGKNQYNLYFSSWLCVWTTLWLLERWCTSSGRASFASFIRSWPNRCPLWIMTFLLSFMDFLFALDAHRHWEEGTKMNPYVYKLYSDVNPAQWTLLLFVTCFTFTVSFAWALAEIFRENRLDVESTKSAVETYVEGITAHMIAIIWIITVCIVTMPGGVASLLGNLYFTTWGTMFSVIGTTGWWLRDWRQGILDVIQEQQEEYDAAKRSIRRREETRLAHMAEEEAKSTGTKTDESKMEDDDDDHDAVLCEDDPVADDDITINTSDFSRSRIGSASSIASNPDRQGRSASSVPISPDASTSSGFFSSALSYIFPAPEDPEFKPEAQT